MIHQDDTHTLFVRMKILGLVTLAVGLSVSTSIAQSAEQIETHHQELQSLADEQGSIPVIIEFDMEYQQIDRSQTVLMEQQRTDIQQNSEAVQSEMEQFEVRNIKEYRNVPQMALTVDREALDHLIELDNVKRVQEDKLLEPYLDISTEIIGAVDAWENEYTGDGQTIAILDTGIDSDHPFFEDRIVEEACFSTGDEEDGIESLCPEDEPVVIGEGAADDCDEDISGCGHGTHVGGIAAGYDDDIEMAGVAPEADIVSIQVFHKQPPENCDSDQSCARTFLSDLNAALDWLFDQTDEMNIASANMSLGGGEFYEPCDDHMTEPFMQNLKAENVAPILSSGNDGFTDAMGGPACAPSAISVGSTENDPEQEDVSAFSNSADFLDLLAPGAGIESANFQGGTIEQWGTSMAAPHVAGAWAMLQQKNPDASIEENLETLQNTGEPILDERNDKTFPRIQVDDALDVVTETFTVYYNNPEDWDQVNIWVWEDGGDDLFDEWPGEPMNEPDEDSEWYSYEIPGNYDYVIFNDGSASDAEQTHDIPRNETGWFDGFQWYEDEPELDEVPVVESVGELLNEGTVGEEYQFGNEAIVTFVAPNFRNQHYISDESGAVVIDDPDEIISGLRRGDEIYGARFELSEFDGTPQLLPKGDPTAFSRDNDLPYWETTLEDLQYEGEPRLIRINDVQFQDSGTFEASTNYDILDPTVDEPVTFRTHLGDSDVIGEQIPEFTSDIYGIASEFEGEAQLYAAHYDLIVEDAMLSVYEPGWQLVSLPFFTNETEASHWFDYIITNSIYAFENGTYSVSEAFKPGNSMWVRFTEEEELLFQSDLIEEVEIDLDERWNLIGSTSEVIEAAELYENEIIVEGTLYDDSYQQADAIKPGHGYWVMAEEDGALTLSETETAKFVKDDSQVESTSYDPAESFYQLKVSSDDDESYRELFVAGELPEELDIRSFSLPPLPPSEVFDVRFEDNYRLVEETSATIEVQHQDEPVVVALDQPENIQEQGELWQFELLSGGEVINTKEINTGESFEVTDSEVDKITLNATEVTDSPKQKEKPEDFALDQNYPNPFNPATVISYDLPETAHVTLEVYDLQGRLIGTLVDEEQQAGNHEATWDASDLASGVYLYRLSAGDFVQTRKMMFVK